ncbi:MAG: hypothetical protein HY816_18830 [Candidatus Wallbacteria bacterium]|nr:hypothetical protein [Candidatus Wallbacteria bacterium]
MGYDVMVRVGLARFVEYRQREEIRASLAAEGISLSTGTISELGRSFLTYLERLHLSRADRLRAALESDGGWPLHVDATGEQGRGTLLIALAGWRRWVLGAWKLPTERADAILPCLQSVAKSFGAPCAAVRDLGKAVIEALEQFVASLGLAIRIFSCHLHFLRDIGNDLLKESHDQLRELVRSLKIRTNLAALVRDLSRDLGSELSVAREQVRQWHKHLEQGHRLPEGPTGVACVRAWALWVLDYAADGHDDGFPFDRPYLDLYKRGGHMRRAIDAYLRQPPASRAASRALNRLGRILQPLRDDARFTRVAKTLSMRVVLFEKLREALRLRPKPSGRRSTTPTATPSIEQATRELRDIRKAVLELRGWLKNNRPERGPAEPQRKAFDIILKHLDTHGRSLWGHVIHVSQPASGTTKVLIVDRTNNVDEHWFHGQKHDERRRCGRKNLAQDFEQLPAQAAYARNLLIPDYVELVCGSLDRLPAAFAELDRHQLDAAAERQPPFLGIVTAPVSASLPKVDRKLVREPALEAKILAAARSRAPTINLNRI